MIVNCEICRAPQSIEDDFDKKLSQGLEKELGEPVAFIKDEYKFICHDCTENGNYAAWLKSEGKDQAHAALTSATKI